ncbi:PIN domain-containing protein [Persephonella sp.]
MIIFDTDVLIWILRGKREVIEKAKQIIEDTNGYVYITPVQIAEVYAGARKKEIPDIEKLLNSFRHVEINNEIGKLAGELMGKYRKSHNVELADSLIASCCIVYGFKLWTFNKKHYPMIKKEHLL